MLPALREVGGAAILNPIQKPVSRRIMGGSSPVYPDPTPPGTPPPEAAPPVRPSPPNPSPRPVRQAGAEEAGADAEVSIPSLRRGGSDSSKTKRSIELFSTARKCGFTNVTSAMRATRALVASPVRGNASTPLQAEVSITRAPRRPLTDEEVDEITKKYNQIADVRPSPTSHQLPPQALAPLTAWQALAAAPPACSTPITPRAP